MKGKMLLIAWPSFHKIVDSPHEIPLTYQYNVPRILSQAVGGLGLELVLDCQIYFDHFGEKLGRRL